MTHVRPPQSSLAQPYPPAPWTLQGGMVCLFFRAPANQLVPLVPSPLSPVVLPGNSALGFVAIGQYGPGSTLEYHELIAGVGVHHGLRPAPYITHIAVDSAASQHGGQAIWNLPKQLYQFHWQWNEREGSVRVWDGVRLVVSAECLPRETRLLPMQASIPVLNLDAQSQASLFQAHVQGQCSYASNVQIQIGRDSPLNCFAPLTPIATLLCKGTIRVDAPQRLAD